MTLDLKAKAKEMTSSLLEKYDSEVPHGYLVDHIEEALKEVQDAIRRETIRECGDLVNPTGFDDSIGAYIQKRILALLTTPEKAVDLRANCPLCQTPHYGHFHCGKCGLVGSTTIENVFHICPEKKEG